MAARLEASLGRLAALRSWEAASSRAGMRALDANPCRTVCREMDLRPWKHQRSIHVAGSKGKGTVCALLGAALRSAGRHVGVITSPHVECITERVRIDGVNVDKEKLAEAIDSALEARVRGDVGSATWFDVFTAGALHLVRRCDYAVVECGLGGRRDSTNLLRAPVAVLTSVELEHTEVLGDTVGLISAEKAAIASRGGSLVVSRTLSRPAARAARATAAKRGARVLTPRKRSATSRHARSYWANIFGASNLDVAGSALDELGRRGATTARTNRPLGAWLLRDFSTLRKAHASLPARREWLPPHETVQVMADVAHTRASVHALVASLRLRKPPVVLIALAADKDAKHIFAELAGLHAPAVYCAPLPPLGDGADPEALAVAANCGQLHCVSAVSSTTEALRLALHEARVRGTWVLVFGSFKLCAHVKHKLGHPEELHRYDLP
ncbi:Mur ligase [Pelagophyceae sp. CCMP2097]|nr:Mur ligase [Pelagophyceae sp. CCMP2097]